MEYLIGAVIPGDQSLDSEALVGAVYAAYVEGRKQPVDSSLEAGRRELLLGMGERLKSRLRPQELLVISRCKRCCDASRSVGARANIDGARLLLSAARVFATAESISDEARTLCHSEILAAQGHFEFRCGHFLQARRVLLESLEIDQQLEDDYGYAASHAHRMHLLTRMVALEARISGLESAVQLAAQVFCYLAGTIESVPVPGDWGRKYQSEINPDLRRFFAVQLLAEMAAVTTCASRISLREVLNCINTRLLDCSDPFWHSHVLAWLRLKALWPAPLEVYLPCCAAYLAQNTPRVPTLWYTAALDAALACCSLPGEQSRRFREEVISDCVVLKHLSPARQQFVSERWKNLRNPHPAVCLHELELSLDIGADARLEIAAG